MFNMAFKFLLLLFNCAGVSSGSFDVSTLAYFWPFCNITMAFELMYQFDAERPKKGACPSALDVGPPELGFNVFLFDNDPTGYAAIKINRYTGSWDDLGVVFMISPEADQGVVLDYIADKIVKDTVNSWTVELLDGQVQFTVRYDDGTVVKGQSDARIYYWSWIVVAVSRAKKTGQVVLQIGRSTQMINTADTTEKAFNGQGKLYVSYSLDAAKSVFQGRFCCLALFSSTIPKNMDPDDIITLFNKSSWPNAAPPVKSPCSVGVPYIGPPVIKLWPLQTDALSSFGYDVIQSVAPTAPLQFSCFRAKEIFEYTSSPVGYFDGSKLSYLSMPLTEQTLFSELSIALFIRPDPLAEGVVWEYVSSYRKPNFIYRMSLQLNAGYANVDLYNDSAPCLSIMSPKALAPNTWSFLNLIYSTTDNNVTLMINDTVFSKIISCPRGSVLTMNGTLTVGQGQDFTTPYDAGYRGSAACITIFQGSLNTKSALQSLRDRCISLNKVVAPMSPCNDTDPFKFGRFKLASENAAPGVGIIPVSTKITRSLLECTKMCQELSMCRSFTYRKAEPLVDCQLYDCVTRQGLQLATGTRYYVMV